MTMLEAPPQFTVPEEWIAGMIPFCRRASWRAKVKLPDGADREELLGVALEALMHGSRMWPGYCERNGFDPHRDDYWRAYVSRRVQGALLDWQRAQDWLTRTERQTMKAIEAADPHGTLTEAELAERTGIPLAKIRKTRDCNASLRTTSLSHYTDLPPGYVSQGTTGWEPEDREPGPEEQRSSSELLGALVRAVEALPFDGQVVVALRFYEQLDEPDIAMLTGLALDHVRQLLRDAALTVHQALVAVASSGVGGNSTIG